MDLKDFLFGLLLFIIPLILIILIYRIYIYKICHNNEQCIKKKLMYNLDDISNYIKNIVPKKKEIEEEQIEGFFSGIVDWFYPNPAPANDDNIQASNIDQNKTDPLQNNKLETSPLSGENNDSNNNEFLKSLSDKSQKFNNFSNANIKSISDIDNINKQLEKEINNKVDKINSNSVKNGNKTPTNFIEKNAKNDNIPLKYETNSPKDIYSPLKMEKQIPLRTENFKQESEVDDENVQKNDTSSQNVLLNINKCNFYHDVCPSNYVDIGNFSIGGLEKNMTLNCGDVQNTKPAKAVAVIKNNEINDVIVSDKGQGFNPQKPPKVEVVGGGGRGAELKATIDDDGYLQIIKVVHPGYNYNETPNIIIESPMMNSSCHLCCKK